MDKLTDAKEVMESFSDSIDAEKLRDVEATFLFDLSGDDGGEWTVDVNEGQLSVAEGRTGTPTVTVRTTTENLKALLDGDLNPMTAFMKGKIKVEGDMSTAMKLQSLLG